MLMFDRLAFWMYDHPAGVIGFVVVLAMCAVALIVAAMSMMEE